MADRKLIAYGLPSQPLEIRPAPHEREWMDATDSRYAYRCLPLTIANAHGWEVLCSSGFSAWWNGDRGADGVVVTPDHAGQKPAVSHFGYGVLTFHLSAVFRTAPGYDMMVQGPINRPKDAIAPVSGLVETDWTAATFTMNWQFTRPNTVIRFEHGEPFCHIFPTRRGELERLRPELRPIEDNPELKAEFDAWTASRASFLDGLRTPGSEASNAKWQKHYYRGRNLSGSEAAGDDHRTKIRLSPFARVVAGEVQTE
jgi:hypothetical protein